MLNDELTGEEQGSEVFANFFQDYRAFVAGVIITLIKYTVI